MAIHEVRCKEEEEEELDDILSPSLHLEQTYYNSGYASGQTDGAKIGLVEGRRFGLENGFEKFRDMGRLHGWSIVLNSRLPISFGSGLDNHVDNNVGHVDNDGKGQGRQVLAGLWDRRNESEDGGESARQEVDLTSALATASVSLLPQACDGRISLRSLDCSGTKSRLGKHVSTLYALTELESLSIENTESAVSDFDDRYRRAVAKAGIVGRMIMERFATDGVALGGADVGGRTARGEGEVEDIIYTRPKSKNEGSEVYTDDQLEIEIR